MNTNVYTSNATSEQPLVASAFDAWVLAAGLQTSLDGWRFMHLPTDMTGQLRFAVMHSAPKVLIDSLEKATIASAN